MATIEQQRALAKAKARLRLQKPVEEPVIPPNELDVFNLARESGFVKGYLDPAAGGAQAIQHAIPRGWPKADLDPFIKQEEQAYQQRRAAEGEEGFDWARLAGGMASPPSLAVMGTAAPATLLGRMAQGTVAGAGLASMQPVTEGDYATTKALQTAGGAAIGAATPVVLGAGKAGLDFGKQLLRPASKKGIQKDVEEFYREMAGESAPDIIKALEQYKMHIPGSKPTSGQAIAEANLAYEQIGQPKSFGSNIVRLERDLAKKPVTGDILKTKEAQAAASRMASIPGAKTTLDDIVKLENARDLKTSALYDKAAEVPIKADSKLIEISNNPYFKDAIADANKLAQASGINTKDNLTKYLHFIKLSLDKQLAKTGDNALGSTEKRAVREIKRKLVKWLGVKNPIYEEARSTYAEMSKPINRLKLGQFLEQKLTPSGKEAPGSYLKTLKEAPQQLKKVTKFPYKNIREIYSDKEAKAVERVAKEMERNLKASQMATSAESIYPTLAAGVEPKLVNPLLRPMMIANAVLSKIAKSKEPQYRALASEIQADPDKLLTILKQPKTNPKRQIILNAIYQSSIAAPSISVKEIQ